MFRNLRLYQLESAWPETETDLSDRLAQAAFKPCGSFSELSAGWEPPVRAALTSSGQSAVSDEVAEALSRRIGGADLLRLRLQSRLLPPAAVNEALEERIADFQQRMLRAPGRREKRNLKEEVYSELLPKALLKSDRILGFSLPDEQIIGIDTTSEKQAERFLDQLRVGLGSLQVRPLQFEQPVVNLLTRVFLGDGPRTFVTGRECRMQDPAAGGAYVHWSDMELHEASVQKHVRDGLKIDRLAMEFDNCLGFVLDQQGVMRKLRYLGLDRGAEDAGELADEDPLARLDAEFYLVTGYLRRLLGALKQALGGYA